MAPRKLNLTFHQAHNLTNPIKCPGRLVSPYVKYSLVKRGGPQTAPMITNPHIRGSNNPVWEFPAEIDLPEDALDPGVYNFVAKIKHHSSVIGCDRQMGMMSIPLADMCLTRNRFPYMVTTKNGVSCGTLLISHSVAGDAEVVATTTAVAASLPGAGAIPLAPAQAEQPLPRPQAPPLPLRPQAPPTGNPTLANMMYGTAILDAVVNVGSNVEDMITFD